MSLASWVSDTGTTLALDGTDGVTILRGARGLDGPPVANTIDQRIGDGAVRVNQRRPQRAVQIPLWIDESTITAGEVIGLMQSGTFVADSGRELRSVIYEDGFEGQWTVDSGGVNGLTHRKFNVSLAALDPWWYGPEESLSGTFGAATAWNAATGWSTATPWDGGSSTAITNVGDAPAWCDVVITGASTTVTMSIDGIGGWTTDYTLATSAYLTVSSEPGAQGPHLGPHGHFAEADDPVNWALLTQTSQLFTIPAGSSSLVFGVTGSDANSQWEVFWSPRYLTSS
jgi:hypothetical protein